MTASSSTSDTPGECWDIMRQAYAWRIGQQIPVDVIDGLERARKILAGSRVVPMSPTWKEMDRELTRMIKE